MPNSLFPAAIKVEYDSPYAPHTMILPINQVNLGTPPTLGNTTVDTWASGTKALDVMLIDLIDTFAPFFNSDVVFRLATLLKVNAPPADQTPVPILSWAVGIPGTSVATTWDKATQQTISFRTTEGGQSKLVFLDAQSFNNFDKIVDLTGQTALQDIVDQWTSDLNGWAGRDSSRPSIFLQAARTLNEALRKEYRMN